MQSFDEITSLAAARQGGMAGLEARLAETPVRPPEEIAALPAHRLLAEMTRRVFCAGFSHQQIAQKWPAFEAAFDGFDPGACASIDAVRFDALTANPAIVRNGAKIKSVCVNARLLLDLAQEHGSAARFFADWPDADYVGLLDLLKKRGSHLGGDSGMRFLRAIGKPAFVTAPDVVAALIRAGVLSRAPGGKGDLAAIQAACNRWSAESGRNLTEISRILAMSIDRTA